MNPKARKQFIESIVKELRSSTVRSSDADWHLGFKSDTPVEESEYDRKTGKVINNTEIGDHSTFLQQWDADNTGFLEGRIMLADLLKEVEEGELEEGSLKNIAAATAISLAGLVSKGQRTGGPVRMDIGPSFASGYHSIEKLPVSSKHAIEQEFKKLVAGILANPTAHIEFTIQSGESKVTNKDAEKPNKPRLADKELGNMRSESAEEYVRQFMEALKREGTFKGTYNITITPTVVGKTAYLPGTKPDPKLQSQYEEEQFVKIIADIQSVKTSHEYVTASDDIRVFDTDGHVIADFFKKVRAAKDFESGNLGINNPNDYYAVRFVNDKTGQYEPGTYLVNKGDYNITSGLTAGASRENIERLKSLPNTKKIDQNITP